MSEAKVSTGSQRRRKIQALTASGIVLGIGAAVTFATWSDSEGAWGAFGAGKYVVESSADGETYKTHGTDSSNAAELSFNAGNLSPGNTVYAPFSLRLQAGSTYDGELNSIRLTSTTGDTSELSYQIYQSETCSDNVSTDTKVAGGTLDDATATPSLSTPIRLSHNAGDTSAINDSEDFCLAVTAGSGLKQGQQADAIWTFATTSREDS